MGKKKAAKAGNVEVACAFCRGVGKDPFGIMSNLSTCCVCQGKGHVTVPMLHERCAHCNGTGAIKTFTCTTCHGKGLLSILKGPTQPCPNCNGTGDDLSARSMNCLTCRGRGKIQSRIPNS